MKPVEFIDIVGVGKGKCCSKCERVLPLTCFSVHNARRASYASRCKECYVEDRRRSLGVDKSAAAALVREHGKTCCSCGQRFPASAFGKHSYSGDGYQGACRNCVAASQRKSRTPEKSRRQNLKKLYGIGLNDYERMLAAQGRRCFICCVPHSVDAPLHVDHDHATNVVRGLLCSSCNNGLGRFRDSTANLARAIQYLSGSLRKVA